MGNIIKLDNYEKKTKKDEDQCTEVEGDDYNLNGTIVCTSCSFEWEGVAIPNELFPLECPSCFRQFGEMKYPVYPNQKAFVWYCECRNDLFFVLKDSILCRKCGKIQEF
jgi:hypothetical protein